MKDNELLIAVPTLNHPKLVMFYLANILDVALEHNIDICIYDASSDDRTEQIVQKRVLQGYSNLFYKRYPENTLLEDRCGDIYVNSGHKYVWLCGDGCVLNLRKSIDIIQNEIAKNKDIICLDSEVARGVEYKEYTDAVKFCRECFAATTYFGGVILNTELVSKQFGK